MEKNFDEWNEKKKLLQNKDSKIVFREGEIWWCSLGQNIKTESFGKGENFRRPILILKKLSSDTCIAIPLTSKEKVGTWFTPCILHGVVRYAMLYQVRMLHSNRFQWKIGELDSKDYLLIKKAFNDLLNT